MGWDGLAYGVEPVLATLMGPKFDEYFGHLRG